MEEAREINSRLQQKIDRDSKFLLIVEIVVLLIIVSTVAAILFLYTKWLKEKMNPASSQIIEIDRQREGLDARQNAAALISSDSDTE